jgi:hypothetical protein
MVREVPAARAGRRNMKRIILLIGMLLAFDVRSGFDTGNDLLRYCKNYERDDATFVEGVCAGHVVGVFDMMVEFPIPGARICPGRVERGQVVRVVVKYVKEHPEQLHLPAVVLTKTALVNAFPCSN